MASPKELPMYVVDAFSSKPFGGNQAAICLLENDKEISDTTKQKLASEMNYSETAFLSKLDPSDSFQTGRRFGLRWFTPQEEVPLCGHATLATYAVLLEQYGNKNDRVTFETMRGPLYASAKDGKVVLDFPSLDTVPVTEKHQNLVQVLSCGRRVVDAQISKNRMLLVRLEDSISRSEFEGLNADAPAMFQAANDGSIFLVILTAKGKDGYDFFSRIFAPWLGVNEDPVCGSAHCVLTPYWAKVLGKTELSGRQCSKRGGDLYLRLREEDERVDIAGHASIVLKGSVFV